MATTRSADGTFRRARAAVAATFGSHAVVAGTIGPWVPRLKANAGLDAGGLGVALFGFAFGLVSGTRLAGPVTRRFGARRVVRVGIPTLAGTLSLLPFAGGLIALAASFAVVGVVSGLLDVAMNDEAVAVEDAFGRRVMSSMHATWSVSMLAGAAAASLGIAAGVPINAYIPGVTVVLIAGTVPMLRWLPRREAYRHDDADAPVAAAQRSFTDIALLCTIAAAAFMTEGIAAEWSAVYLREAVGAAAAVAGLGVVAFSGGMAISRFAGDRLAERFAPRILVRWGPTIGGIALAASILAAEPALTIGALVILGVGLGPAVPLAFSAAGRVRWPNGPTALSIVVTAGYVGSIVGPLLVGLTAELAGLRAAFAIPVVMCVAIAAAAPSTSSPSAGTSADDDQHPVGPPLVGP